MQIAYNIDVVKSNIPEALEVLSDAVLNPRFTSWEVAEAVQKIEQDIKGLKENPQTVLLEVSIPKKAVCATRLHKYLQYTLIACARPRIRRREDNTQLHSVTDIFSFCLLSGTSQQDVRRDRTRFCCKVKATHDDVFAVYCCTDSCLLMGFHERAAALHRSTVLNDPTDGCLAAHICLNICCPNLDFVSLWLAGSA